MGKNRLMMGLWRFVIDVPPFLWKKKLPEAVRKYEAHRGFMTREHNAVHHFVVRELPRLGRPMPPGHIADSLSLPLGTVNAILDDLEKHMTFLFRNQAGEVVWAYPVTVEKTPHRVTFDTGETIYAA
ncbi:MAG: hypothetical protein CVU61_08720 [Deltaproteobacteria bacterium HGW-Deltaproteobacteria-19]|jgi:hypothetical protein|nr:MAG: hypothetical protein CVU61_08720 [Deltaproteobacteria bacterium HGW-Deltaproteobacteria-19]